MTQAVHSLEAAERDTKAVDVARRPDGSILLTNPIVLPEFNGTLAERLAYWGATTPGAVWLVKGDRSVTYAEAARLRAERSACLLALPVSLEKPLMIVGENGIDHALWMLAASAIGVPAAIVAPAYAASTASPWQKLARVFDQVDPGLILADDRDRLTQILAVLGRECRVEALDDPSWATARANKAALRKAEASVGLDTVAKLLFTSGSTGTPKAVMNTQRMLVSNMQALGLVWPFLAERPPVLIDWLPWNHTFGGNCCFNIALWFGGRLQIDEGRPAAALIGRTVEALRRNPPSIYFNVPFGYELLLATLESDPVFARDFFGGLDFLFSAGAPLPNATRARLEAVAVAAIGAPPNIVGGWGATETAPFSTALTFPTAHAANLGLPIPGTTLKLVPESGRFELRVKGPNVTPGYWRDPAATAQAFDEEGFYRIGDAGRFADPEDPSMGVVFDGRVVENFKLASGTFVNVGALRLAVISAGDKLISDAVVAGEGRNELGLIVFANDSACRSFVGEAACAEMEGAAAAHPRVQGRLRELLDSYNRSVTGSSMRIARFIVAAEPLNAQEDEITDKGYINQRRVLARRASEVERLFREGTAVCVGSQP